VAQAGAETLFVQELFQTLLARLPLDQPELFLLGGEIVLGGLGSVRLLSAVCMAEVRERADRR
jgi:hypothetical protein